MHIHQHICASILLISTLALPLSGSVAVEATRTVVKEWVATEQAISREAIQWQETQRLLEDLTQVSRSEISTLQESLRAIQATASSADARRAALVEEQDRLTAERATIAEFLSAIEPALSEFKGLLPEPLSSRLEPFYQRIPTDPSSTKLGIAERMQTVVGILNTVNTFDRSITVHEEIRTLGDGSQGEVTTVYVGLGAAYYRTRSGDDAGCGQPGSDGWQWHSQPELSAAIAEVIAAANNTTQAARFIALPVELHN